MFNRFTEGESAFGGVTAILAERETGVALTINEEDGCVLCLLDVSPSQDTAIKTTVLLGTRVQLASEDYSEPATVVIHSHNEGYYTDIRIIGDESGLVKFSDGILSGS